MNKTRSHVHMFQRIFKLTKFALYLHIFIFAIEQDICVMRLNGLLKPRCITWGYKLVLPNSYGFIWGGSFDLLGNLLGD
jgi:hypothetical protein